jgi:polysaccharide deacetylase family protein (PEP-CTERM system associated)
MTRPMRILTFDIEDWFHLLEHDEVSSEGQWSSFESRIDRNTNVILECLAEVRMKATFFCLGWAARKHPEVIRAISAADHEIGTHSDIHRLTHHLTPAEFRADLLKSIKSLEDVTGRKVRAHRSPGFSITRKSTWAVPVLAESGIELDSSIFASRHSHGGLPDFNVSGPAIVEHDGTRLKQFPVVPGVLWNRSVNFSGGGYFRLLPYPVVKLLMSKSEYAMTYFHPRDFDPGQPVMPGLPALRIFKSYVGLRSSLNKFKRLLGDFDFIDIGKANELIDWSTRPTVNLSDSIKHERGATCSQPA